MGNPVEHIVEGLIAAKVGKPVPKLILCETVDLLYLENTLIVHGK